VRDVRLEQAQILLAAKEWAAARELATTLADAQDPGVRNQALLVVSDTLMGEERWADALALVDRAEGSPLMLARRAEIAVRSGRRDEGARRLAELADSSDPQQALAAVQALHRLELYHESIAPLTRFTAARPDHAVAAFLLGAAYERTGRRDLAEAPLRRTIELEPDFHAALNYLGYTFADGGYNLDEAVRLVRRAIALDPDNGAYVDSLGWAYFRLGKNEEAQLLLERAARLEPEDAVLHEHLGDVYAALGQKERARQAYQRALELDDAANRDQVRKKLDDLGSAAPR
jgi:Flp pilus assembly protein TadD